MQDVISNKQRLCCDNCGKCFDSNCKEGKDDKSEEVYENNYKLGDDIYSNSYFSKAGRFLCEQCAQVNDEVIVVDETDLLIQYFKLLEVFEEFKKRFAEKKLEPFKEQFKGKLSIDFIKKLNPLAYELLRNSKHFGIKKEKHRAAQEYVKNAKKGLINYLNVELYNDEVISILRREILEKQIDIIFLKRQLSHDSKVYIHNKENPQFYEYSERYTDILKNACADGSNVGYSGDDYLIQELFDKMADKMLRLDIWNKEEES